MLFWRRNYSERERKRPTAIYLEINSCFREDIGSASNPLFSLFFFIIAVSRPTPVYDAHGYCVSFWCIRLYPHPSDSFSSYIRLARVEIITGIEWLILLFVVWQALDEHIHIFKFGNNKKMLRVFYFSCFVITHTHTNTRTRTQSNTLDFLRYARNKKIL